MSEWCMFLNKMNTKFYSQVRSWRWVTSGRRWMGRSVGRKALSPLSPFVFTLLCVLFRCTVFSLPLNSHDIITIHNRSLLNPLNLSFLYPTSSGFNVVLNYNSYASLILPECQPRYGLFLRKQYFAITGTARLSSLWILRILILSGDIHINPGPTIIWDHCIICSKVIRSNQTQVRCIDCNAISHQSSKKRSKFSCAQPAPDGSWICPTCIAANLPFADISHIDSLNLSVNSSASTNYLSHNGILPDFKPGLRVAHLNVNGIRSKLDQLSLLLLDAAFDVFVIIETKLTPDVPDCVITFDGYSQIRKDHSSGNGKGYWSTFVCVCLCN